MKKILSLALFLSVVSAIAGGMLAVVNSVTKPIIEANALAAVKATLEEFYPGADFKEIAVEGEPVYITNVYEAAGKGTVYSVSTQGFKDTIIFMVAVDNDGTISSYKVQQNNDTSGIGTRVSEAEFSDKFIGSGLDVKFDTLSGATVSSTAVVRGLEEVVDYQKANRYLCFLQVFYLLSLFLRHKKEYYLLHGTFQ